MAYKRELIINNGSLTSYKKLLKVSNVCQLLDKSKYPATNTANGVTFTHNGDGTITANGTATGFIYYNIVPARSILLSLTHKYLLVGCPAGGGWNSYILYANHGGNVLDYDMGQGAIATPIKQSATVTIYIKSGVTVTNLIFKPQLFDLTEMYGAGNEPKTVAEFRAKFPNDLYNYSPRCWVTSYKTGLIAKTKNLFDWSGKLRQDYDTANCTIVETLTNGAILQGHVGSKPGSPFYDNGWFRPGAEDGYGTKVTLSANDIVTISADYEILERNYASPATIGVYLYGTQSLANQSSQIETGVLYRIKATYTITKDGQYYPVFTLNSSKVKITNIQIEKGTTATDYVPYGYL